MKSLEEGDGDDDCEGEGYPDDGSLLVEDTQKQQNTRSGKNNSFFNQLKFEW